MKVAMVNSNLPFALLVKWEKKLLKKPEDKHDASFPNIYPMVAHRIFLSISYKTQIGINSSEL